MFADRCQGLDAALSIPVAALLWTLPLQLLHFGAMPLYALPANLLVAPLLAPLTLLAMLSALLVVMCPQAVLLVVLWPVQQLAGLVMAIATWISHWPGLNCSPGAHRAGSLLWWCWVCCLGYWGQGPAAESGPCFRW